MAVANSKNERIASLMKELYSNGGYLPLTQIAKYLNCVPKEASEWVSKNQEYFRIVNNEGGSSNVSVLGITQVTLCSEHISKFSSCQGCDSLHICKFFVLGNSCKFGANCKFIHNFETVHNRRILEKYHLHQLNELELKCLFQKVENRCEVTRPTICKFFNNGCCKKEDCICLHICRHYLKNDCNFGKHCKINHQLDTRNIEILEIYGIMFSSISDALGKLRILYNVPNKMKADDICLYNLSPKQCSFKDTCRYHHKEMPYQWQYKMMNASGNDEWHDFKAVWNELIEKEFCNLAKEIHINCDESTAKFQFNIMRCSMAKQEYLLHRLSTVSYKSDPRSPLATTWLWYWKDRDDIWKEYGSSSSSRINVKNEDIEKSYLDNPEGSMVIQTEDNYEVEINFQQMFQKIINKREVIRRPKFISQHTAAKLRQMPIKSIKKLNPNHEIQPSDLPLNWEVPADVIEISSHYKVAVVDESSEEYKAVSDQFDASMEKYVITRIERIENGNLREYYSWKKMKMTNEISSQDLRELNLFHGMELNSIDAVCKQGFDVRLSEIQLDSKYGKGIYFYKDAAFANNFVIPVNGECKMLLAKVLIGEFIEGNPSYVRPPQKNLNEKGGKLYDTCVDNVNEPKLFVVFSNEQIYPAYVITYMKSTD